MTIGYPKDSGLSLLTAVTGTVKPFVITIHYRKFPIEDLPLEEEALKNYLYQRFQEKDKLLEFFYEHGVFPKWDADACKVDTSRQLEPRDVVLSRKKVAFVYVFYSLLAYVTWYIFVSPFLTFGTSVVALGTLVLLAQVLAVIGNYFTR